MSRKQLFVSAFSILSLVAINRPASAVETNAPETRPVVLASTEADFPAYVVYYRSASGHWLPTGWMSYAEALRTMERFQRNGIPAYVQRVR